MSSLHVLIIGGGPGGLCLAQGLKKKGVSFGVYERDRSLTSRLQGCRVHINPTGSKALHQCLPHHLYKAFVDTCGGLGGKVTFLTEHMDKLLELDSAQRDPVNSHKSVSRITLQQVLLSGLEDAVHLERRLPGIFFGTMAKSSPNSQTAATPQATSSLAPTADRRACETSFCRMPKGSTRE
jgi:2-polyprenyl-6-methoxyphenol hydroxylase-like FAD-dependent oxidoreductase